MHNKREFEERFRTAEKVFNRKNSTSNRKDIFASFFAGISVAVSNAAQSITTSTIQDARTAWPAMGYWERTAWTLDYLSTPLIFGGALFTLTLTVLTFIRFDSRHLNHSAPYLSSKLLIRYVTALSIIVFLGHFSYFEQHFEAIFPVNFKTYRGYLSEHGSLYFINSLILIVAALGLFLMEKLVVSGYENAKDLNHKVYAVYKTRKQYSKWILVLAFAGTIIPWVFGTIQSPPLWNIFLIAILVWSIRVYWKQRREIVKIYKARNLELNYRQD